MDASKGTWMNLRSDGYVDMIKDRAAVSHYFGVEYLRPRNFFDMTFNEQQLGLVVSNDLPLRVVGFTKVRISNASKPPPRCPYFIGGWPPHWNG